MSTKETRPLTEKVALALQYSRNYVAAAIPLATTPKEHIEGLCDLAEELVSALASQPAEPPRGEPVAWQCRGRIGGGWSEWQECKREDYESRVPLSGWGDGTLETEFRELFDHAQPKAATDAQVDEPVAYRYALETGKWTVFLSKARAKFLRDEGAIVDPLYTHPAPTQVLDEPAKVGAGEFGKGVAWATVIACAQRAYKYKDEPKLTDEQIAAFRDALIAPPEPEQAVGDGEVYIATPFFAKEDTAPNMAVATAGDGVTEVRAAFETWVRRETELDLERQANGEYAFAGATDAWSGWQAALASPSAPRVGVPEGWKLVPVEPTEEMLRATRKDVAPTLVSMSTRRTLYRCMLAAAPEVDRG